MLSAVIPSALSYPAVPLARQPVHQRCVHPGPLVLGTDPLKSPSPTADRDRTVSRRSKPSSRTTLIGEQQPLGPAPAPGCDEPTSRCQTSPSLWTLGGDQPVQSLLAIRLYLHPLGYSVEAACDSAHRFAGELYQQEPLSHGSERFGSRSVVTGSKG